MKKYEPSDTIHAAYCGYDLDGPVVYVNNEEVRFVIGVDEDKGLVSYVDPLSRKINHIKGDIKIDWCGNGA